MLYAAEGLGNDEIAARLDTPRQVVSPWRKRFFQQRLAGLADLPRGGRPPVFPPDVVVAVKALACQQPADRGVPLSRWHCPELARAAVEQGIVASVSDTTVWRWLSADAIRPWQHRSWICPRDPDFATKAARVLDLYARRWGAAASARTTTSSAPTRRPPSRPAGAPTQHAPAPHRPMRVEHEYRRGGALAYLTAPACRVLILTSSDEDAAVYAALRSGAHGCPLKSSTPEEITRAFHAVTGGDGVYDAALVERITRHLVTGGRATSTAVFPQLSDRERDVLTLMARGLSNCEVADHYVLSLKTVRNHVSSVLAKLGAATRAEAIVAAREAGLGGGPDLTAHG